MAKETIIRQDTGDYNVAVQTIKEAILRSQYQPAKLVNREMLSLYYGIGRYISTNSRKGFWETRAIRTISERTRIESPRLIGFSHHIIILTEETNILRPKFSSTKVYPRIVSFTKVFPGKGLYSASRVYW